MGAFAFPLAVTAMALGTGVQAYGQYQAGKEAKKMHYQRSAALQRKAKGIERAGLEKQALLTEEKYSLLGAQRAKYGKAGVRVGAGTPLVVAAHTAAQYERDKAVIGEETVREAAFTREEAAWERKIGKSRYKAGKYGAGASLLTGGANIASMYWWRGRELGTV